MEEKKKRRLSPEERERIRRRKKRRKRMRRIKIAFLLLFLVLCVVSAWNIYAELSGAQQDKEEFAALSGLRQQAQMVHLDGEVGEGAGDPENLGGLSGESTRAILPEYVDLYAQNNDLFGWITIENTVVDYPVMHTPEDQEYYLHRAFNGRDSGGGVPFLAGSCAMDCGNYIVYGHHMKNGSMFASITEFAKEAYYEDHKTVWFDTLYDHGEYVVMAAFYEQIPTRETDEAFRYYRYVDLTDPEVFNEYIQQVKQAALYDTGITAEYGEQLLTLSTCSYHANNGRFVVVAKKVS